MIPPGIHTFAFRGKKSIAEGTTEVTLDTRRKDFAFEPGQYVRITLLSLQSSVKGGNTRDFSIVSSPSEKGRVRIALRDSNSPFKRKLFSLGRGDTVEVQGPLGSFVLPEDAKRPVVLVAGGIGITPFLPMIRRAMQTGGRRRLHLAYANTSEARAAYLKELRAAAKASKSFTLDERYGALDAKYLASQASLLKNPLWYVCGPPEMVLETARTLIKIGVPDERVRTEEYVGYGEDAAEYRAMPPIRETTIRERKGIDKNIADALLLAVGQTALVSMTDAQGTITFANDTFVAVSKYERKELLGQNHRILKSGEHSPAFYKELWETIASGKVWRGDIKNRAKDGSTYWVDTSIVPIRDRHKRIREYISVRFLITARKNLELAQEQAARDISDAKAAMLNLLEDLQEEKIRISAMLEQLGEGMVATDAHGLTTLLNPASAALFGIAPEKAIGKPFIGLFKALGEDGNPLAADQCPCVRALKERKTVSLRFAFVRKDGEHIRVDTVVSPLIIDGQLIGTVGVFRDLSQEFALESARTDFVSLASHQLRTPLATMGWYLEMLMAGDAGPLSDEQMKYVQETFEADKRMAILVDALLNVSRLEAGKFTVNPEPTDVVALCKDVVKEIEPQVFSRKQELIEEYPRRFPSVRLDPEIPRIVLQNLLSNASKYTPPKGKIILRLKKSAKDFSMEVEDNGYGIPNSEQDKVFQKFFRAGNIRKTDVQGTGLGLYIVKRVIEEVGGSVGFVSSRSRGTTFTVTLPLSGMRAKKGTRTLIEGNS